MLLFTTFFFNKLKCPLTLNNIVLPEGHESKQYKRKYWYDGIQNLVTKKEPINQFKGQLRNISIFVCLLYGFHVIVTLDSNVTNLKNSYARRIILMHNKIKISILRTNFILDTKNKCYFQSTKYIKLDLFIIIDLL